MMYTANQPLALGGQYYMWERYSRCTYIVDMASAQLTKKGHQSRIELMDKHGSPQMFVIDLKDRTYKPLNEVQLLDAQRTVSKLHKTLSALYAKTPYYLQVMDLIERAYPNTIEQGITLAEFNSRLLRELLKTLLPETTLLLDTDVLPVRPESPSAWMAQFGHVLECNQYLGGGIAKDHYVDDQDFTEVEYVVQDWIACPYKRGLTYSDYAQVSILDPLMYCGTNLSNFMFRPKVS